MRIYVDIQTGTYGETKDLKVLDVTEEELRIWDFMAESEIVDVAKRVGKELP